MKLIQYCSVKKAKASLCKSSRFRQKKCNLPSVSVSVLYRLGIYAVDSVLGCFNLIRKTQRYCGILDSGLLFFLTEHLLLYSEKSCCTGILLPRTFFFFLYSSFKRVKEKWKSLSQVFFLKEMKHKISYLKKWRFKHIIRNHRLVLHFKGKRVNKLNVLTPIIMCNNEINVLCPKKAECLEKFPTLSKRCPMRKKCFKISTHLLV